MEFHDGDDVVDVHEGALDMRYAGLVGRVRDGYHRAGEQTGLAARDQGIDRAWALEDLGLISYMGADDQVWARHDTEDWGDAFLPAAEVGYEDSLWVEAVIGSASDWDTAAMAMRRAALDAERPAIGGGFPELMASIQLISDNLAQQYSLLSA